MPITTRRPVIRRRHSTRDRIQNARRLAGPQFGYAAHQTLAVRMLGVVVDLFDRSYFYHLARIHHPDSGRDPSHNTQVMSDVHDGCIKKKESIKRKKKKKKEKKEKKKKEKKKKKKKKGKGKKNKKKK